MIDIKQIVDGVKDFYKHTPATGGTSDWDKLQQKIKEWVGGDGRHLVSFKPNIGQVVVVVGQRDTPLGAPLIHSYTLCRFFSIGNRWEVSVDHQNIDAEEMMHELMNNVKL